MKDDLGDRMKSSYEDRTRYMLPRRTYTLLRLDGKSFHTYTRGLNKPFDADLFSDIDAAIIAMLPQFQGAVFAYTQSDEVSVLLTDFAQPTTSAWFDGNLQKMCSVAASIITAEFNKLRMRRRMRGKRNGLEQEDEYSLDPLAYFDARVFTIPDRIEVMNYFIWRNQDCSRNSVSMVAQSLFSHKELQGKSTADMHEMIHGAGKNWATDFTDGEKNGRVIVKEQYVENVELPKTPAQVGRDETTGIASTPTTIYAPRSRWVSEGAWKFTENKEKLLEMIPKYE
jgi:tRNA(His) guanylyltransferase